MRIFVICFLASFLPLGAIAKTDCKVRLQQCENRKPPPRKPVCGTDNQTYPNRCALLRIQCMHNSPLTVKHKGKCKEKQPCWLDQAKKLNKNNGKDHKAGTSDYIPECLADGTYAPVQCHNSMGYCWCVTPNGKMIQRTTARHRKLECPRKGRTNTSSRDSSDNTGNSAKKGCDETNKSIFISNLVRIFKTEYNRDVFGKHAMFPRNQSLVNLEETALQWKFFTLDKDRNNSLNRNEYRDLRKLIKKVVKPKKCSRAFVRLCDSDHNSVISKQEWMACLNMNTTSTVNSQDHYYRPQLEDTASVDAEAESDDTGADLVEADNSDPTSVLESTLPLDDHSPDDEKDLDGKMDCHSDRKAVLEESKTAGTQEMYVPECMPDGRYKKVQCYHSTGYCWCVLEDSGKPIPGTSVKDLNPKCDSIQQPMKGCAQDKKLLFIRNLLDFFQRNLTNSESHGMEQVSRGGQERYDHIASLSFHTLDTNKNEVLDRKEWKMFRSMMDTSKVLKRCGRKFPRYCDTNSDKKITKSEWLQCLSLQSVTTSNSMPSTSSRATRRQGPNPIESLLKEDD